MIELKYKNYVLKIPEEIYLPAEDTYLLLETIQKKIKNKKINDCLEMGFGNGIISLELYDQCKQLFCVDINPIATKYFNVIKKKYNLKNMKIIKSNLFEKIKTKKFDLIIFNPPYVPSEKIEDNSTDGGRYGRQTIIPFINQLPKHLKKQGECYLLISSLNNIRYIKKQINKNKLQQKIIGKQKLFFETLYILEIKLCQQM